MSLTQWWKAFKLELPYEVFLQTYVLILAPESWGYDNSTVLDKMTLYFLDIHLNLISFRTPRPVAVKQMEHEEDEDGILDENVKRNPDFQK